MSTTSISNEVVSRLVELRGSYDYPKAYIQCATQNNYDIQLGRNIFGIYVQPENDAVTDLDLDNYHYSLLRSNIREEQLLGLASVLYWGYYTFGHNYACVRVDRLINGYKIFPPTTMQEANDRIQRIITLTNHGALGRAIGTLSGVSQLNQTPFASKVIAFISPSVAGIYDNRINNGLVNEAWAFQFSGGIGNIKSKTVQKSYQSWCSYLSLIASQINLGIEHGNDWSWSCGSDNERKWRALDVERSLFSDYANG